MNVDHLPGDLTVRIAAALNARGIQTPAGSASGRPAASVICARSSRFSAVMNAEREHGCADDDSRRSAGQQLEPAHATTGCVCTETTIAVPVPSASASRTTIRVVTFMTSPPQSG